MVFFFSSFQFSSTALKGVSYSSLQASAFQGCRWVVDDDFTLLVCFSLSVPILLAFSPASPLYPIQFVMVAVAISPPGLATFLQPRLISFESLFPSRLVGVAIVVMVD